MAQFTPENAVSSKENECWLQCAQSKQGWGGEKLQPHADCGQKSWNHRGVDSKRCKGAQFIKARSKYRENVVRIGKTSLNVCVWLFKAVRLQIGAEEWNQKWHEGCDEGWGYSWGYSWGWEGTVSLGQSSNFYLEKADFFSLPCNIFINAAGGTGSTM